MNANESDMHGLNALEDVDPRRPMEVARDQRRHGGRRKRHINATDEAYVVGRLSKLESEMHSTKDDGYEILQTSNELHMTPDNNDRRRILVSIGQLAPSKRLLLNNADKSVKSDIGFHASSQTKSAQIASRIEAPSNYANDRNLKPPLRKAVEPGFASVRLANGAGRGVDGLANHGRRRYIGRAQSSLTQTLLERPKRSLNANQRDLDYYLTGARSRELIIERGSSSSSSLSPPSPSSPDFSELSDHKLMNPSSSASGLVNSMPPRSRWARTGGSNDDDLEDQALIIDGASNGRSNKALALRPSGTAALVAVTDSVQVAQIDEIEKPLPSGVFQSRTSSDWNRNSKQGDDELARTDRELVPANKLQALNTGYQYDRSETPNRMESAEISANKATEGPISSLSAPHMPDFGQATVMRGQILAPSSTFNYLPPNEGLPTVASSSDTGLFAEAMWPLTPTNVDKLDESLMWSTGQYLYMHMRALAASSIFGVEVDVEWSNERSNGTSFDMIDSQSIGNDGRSEKKISGPRNRRLHYAKAHDATPFATIDVIAGQSLQLQCTGKHQSDNQLSASDDVWISSIFLTMLLYSHTLNTKHTPSEDYRTSR